MTSLAQVTALVDAHVRRDQPRFHAITLQIAANRVVAAVRARTRRGGVA